MEIKSARMKMQNGRMKIGHGHEVLKNGRKTIPDGHVISMMVFGSYRMQNNRVKMQNSRTKTDLRCMEVTGAGQVGPAHTTASACSACKWIQVQQVHVSELKLFKCSRCLRVDGRCTTSRVHTAVPDCNGRM